MRQTADSRSTAQSSPAGPAWLLRIFFGSTHWSVSTAMRLALDVAKGNGNDCVLGFLKAKDETVKDWSGNNLPAPADF